MARVAKVLSKSQVYGETVLIFLTVGNWPKGFDRLVEAVDELKARGFIQDEVVAQIGSGKYRPAFLNAVEYCSPTEFIEFLDKSKIVISHAGMGTIGQAIQRAKPVIVVPRKASLGEHNDDHQAATARQLEAERSVLVAYEVSELPKKIKEAETFRPSNEKNCGQQMIRTIDEFLREAAIQKYRVQNDD